MIPSQNVKLPEPIGSLKLETQGSPNGRHRVGHPNGVDLMITL
jgi:hypothetical protein